MYPLILRHLPLQASEAVDAVAESTRTSIVEVGFAITIAVVFIFFILGVILFVIVRAFGKSGYVSRLCDRLAVFLSKIEELTEAIKTQADNQLQMCTGTSGKIKELHEVYNDPERFETTRLHSAGLIIADLLSMMCESMEVDRARSEEMLGRIRHELEG